MKNKENTWKGDLIGGMISSVMGLPKAIPWGVLVFSPLGPAYAATGAFAGLVAIIFSNLGSAASRGAAILNNGPFSITTLLLASVVPLVSSRTVADNPETIPLIITLVFLTVFMSGLFQALFGLFKAGSLAKYIPYPVIAGLMNGAGIAIFIAQLRPMTGLGKEIPLDNITSVLHHLSIPNLSIGILTLLILWRGEVITRRIPPAFLGLIIGTAFFYLLSAIGHDQNIGKTIGTIPGGIPTPDQLIDFIKLFFQSEQRNLVLELIPIAISIAIVNSLRSLIVTVAIDNVTFERTDSNKELIGQGIGNMLSALFGGISSAGSQSTTIAGFKNGASTSATKIYCALFSLLILILLTPAVSILPEVVLSASLMMMGIEALDSWSIKLLSNLFSKQRNNSEYVDIFIVLVVTGVSVTAGTNEALFVGIFLSVVHFIYRMGKDILARQYDAGKIHSNIIRPMNEIELLRTEGDRIRILELQGALFFGTADKLAGIIEAILNKESERVKYIILNFHKITEMDASGGNLVGQIFNRCKKRGVQVWIASSEHLAMEKRIQAFGAHDSLKNVDFHDNINTALGCAEDQVLDSVFGHDRNQIEKGIDELAVLGTLTGDELQTLSTHLTRSCFSDADVIFRQGDEGDRLFFLLKGRARIEFVPPFATGPSTIATICPGMMFGEMAIIDSSPRSTSIIAEGDAICASITVREIAALFTSHPAIIQKLYQGFAMNLTQRLRIANLINSELQG
jgi:MFS superfamily sulfate permease-like transporter